MKSLIGLLLSFFTIAAAQGQETSGLVTMVAGPTVYASLGRKQGLPDSCLGIIRSGLDTVAVLRLAALSSRSSSWTVLRTTRDISVKDTILVRFDPPEKPDAVVSSDTIRSALALPSDFSKRITRQYEQAPAVRLHGRFSLQYYGIQFDDRTQSMAQPALGFNINAVARDLPIQITVYGIHRQRTRGTLSPLDAKSHPETRLYRASAEYDDGTTMLLAGRIYPMSSLPMSVVDGASVARRFGSFVGGIAGGVDPTLTFSFRQKRLWKGMAFFGYQSSNPFFWGTGLVYTRSYLRSTLVRETASLSFSMFTPSGLSLSGYSDLDLRQPLAKSASGDPSLTSVMVMGSARIHSSVSVSAGIDGARAVPAPADYGVIPDTLFNRTLRSGFTTGISLFIKSWHWNISISPRMGPGIFGKEYSGSTSIGTHNLLSSGVNIRSTANMNSNAFSTYAAYGLQAGRNDLGIDWRIRLQYYGSTIRQIKAKREGTVVGFDLVALLTQAISVMATFDTWRGATYMNVMFVELSWRF